MARILFGSILVPGNADAAYLADLGLSEENIDAAMEDSHYYQTDGAITDPLNLKTDAEDTEFEVPNGQGEGNAEIGQEEQASGPERSENMEFETNFYPSIFKPKTEKKKEYIPPLPRISDVSEWSTFSRTAHTEEEIREKILTDFNNVCFSYLCSCQKLSEEFIPELAALSTGLLNKNNYDRYIDYLKQAVMITEGVMEGAYDLSRLPRNRNITRVNVAGMTTDRLDWKAIAGNQALSPEFQEKYHELLRPRRCYNI